jgi:Ca2+:H+ antiporter
MPAACYLIFQLYTHSWLYVPRPTPDPLRLSPSTAAQLLLYADGPQPPTEGKVFRIPSLPSWGGGGSSTTSGGSSGASASSRGESLRVRSRSVSGEEHEGEADQARAGEELSHSAIHPVATTTSTADVDLEKQGAASAPATEHEEPKLGVWFALGLLVVVTSLTVRSRFLSPDYQAPLRKSGHD